MQDYASIMQQAVLKAMAQNGGTRSAPPAQNPAPSPMSAAQVQALYAHGGALHPNQCGCGGAAPPAQNQMPGAPAGQGFCVESNVGTIPCGTQLTSFGATVQANAVCGAPKCPPITKTLSDCRPLALIQCDSQTLFIVDGFTNQVFPFNFETCDFAATPSTGGCPNNVSPLLAVRDPSQPTGEDKFIFTYCDSTGNVFVLKGKGTWVESDFPIKDCRDVRCVVADNSGALPKFFVHKNITLKSLDVNVTAQVCLII